MKISVICVGKIKEKYFTGAIEEYLKRLSAYAKLEVIEVPDEKTPDNASAAEEEQIKAREAVKILAKLREGQYVVCLAIEGKNWSSEELAKNMGQWALSGKSDVAFVIGGSLGLHDSVLAEADCKLSFGRMTFPHQLMRVLLLEQVYRGFRILRGEPYHK